MRYQEVLDQVYAETRVVESEGQLPDYIPQLTQVDPESFGLALVEPSGNEYRVGDCSTRFSVQSIAKVFALCLAMSKSGKELWNRVGVEPSGDPFNSLALLEYEEGRPRNPLVNPGAMVICDVLLSSCSDPHQELLSMVRELAGADDIEVDDKVAQSERETWHRNRALAELMKSFGNINNSVEDVLNFYVRVCAISMNCRELARAFCFLADRGDSSRRPSLPAELRLSPSELRRVNAIMLTCGFYDEAGEFAFSVGLPGKSGVGGGIAAVCPGRFSVATWSPRLTKGGNSYLGTRALERLTTLTGASIF